MTHREIGNAPGPAGLDVTSATELLRVVRDPDKLVDAIAKLQQERAALRVEREALEQTKREFTDAKEAHDMAQRAEKLIAHNEETRRLFEEHLAELKTL
jgi:hypothetical protein